LRLYVADSFADTVSVISTVTNTVTKTVAVGHYPTDAAIEPPRGWCWGWCWGW
jgi:YVTN family beta-propeller protein